MKRGYKKGQIMTNKNSDASETKEVLGLIGIRSGSKGLPDKNIKQLGHRPLVGWIIKAALASKSITRLIVSTDSQVYADIATKCGADVPFIRPASLAQDNSPEYDYVKHSLDWLEKNESYRPEFIVRLMATSPLQSPEEIDILINILNEDLSADSAVTIAEARQHPMKALKLVNDADGKKKLVSYFGESGREVTPIARQSYEPAYFRSNIIACRTDVVYRTNSLTGDKVRFHIVPQHKSIDIDSELDFELAELLLKS